MMPTDGSKRIRNERTETKGPKRGIPDELLLVLKKAEKESKPVPPV